jgi:hypothetical protein
MSNIVQWIEHNVYCVLQQFLAAAEGSNQVNDEQLEAQISDGEFSEFNTEGTSVTIHQTFLGDRFFLLERYLQS